MDGKNNKQLYYLKGALRQVVPGAFFRKRLGALLDSVDIRLDREYILGRTAYYNKLRDVTALPAGVVPISEFRRRDHHSVYFFDTQELVRWFKPSLRLGYVFGDVTEVPVYPAVVKSRPVEGDNANSVLLKLNKVRHFAYVDNDKPFGEKDDRAVFRAHVTGKPNRIRFMKDWFGSPMCDAGIIAPDPSFPSEWSQGKRISIRQHLDYKFILALEGNDVASNLKWIMSSNSVAVMPRPRYETWFMEGTLVPGVHYIEIKEDFSDLAERIGYYASHQNEAEEIIANAHEYVQQFRDERRELLISLKVLDNYFRMTGQYGDKL